MKLEVFDAPEVESSLPESSEFSFDPTLVSLVLRHKIYTNPGLAMVREVMSNARDANRENKHSKVPIEVSFNALDSSPEFCVKDCGVGIGPSRLVFFTRYGGSSKRDNNKLTGGWGLGAKSPFAVADQFKVHTVWSDESGRKFETTYLMYINEQNKSSCSTLSSTEVDKDTPTFTEVTVPISPDDVYIFKNYAVEVARYWGHPMVKNSAFPKFNWPVSQPSFQKTNKYMEDYSQHGVVLDGIHYPLEMENFAEFPKDYKALVEGLLMFFNTGEIDVNPTRESIEYTSTKNFEAIYDVAQSAWDEISKQVEAELAALKDFPLAVATHLSATHGVRKTIAKALCAEWDIPDLDYVIYDNTIGVDDFILFYKEGSGYYNYNGKKSSPDIIKSVSSNFKLRQLLPGYISGKPNTCVVINDLDYTRINSSIRGALSKYGMILLIKPQKFDPSDPDQPHTVEKLKEAVKNNKYLNKLDLALLSSFPKEKLPEKFRPRSRTKAAAKEVLRKVFDGRQTGYCDKTVGSKSGGVFVVLKDRTAYSMPEAQRFDENGVDRMPEAFIHGNCVNTKDLTVPVYGVLPKSVKDLTGKKWITPYQYKDIASKRMAQQELKYLVALFGIDSLSKIFQGQEVKEVLRFVNKIGDSYLKRLLIKVVNSPYVRIHGMRLVSSAVSKMSYDEVRESTRIKEELEKRYPLIAYFDDYRLPSSDLRKEVALYLRAKRA